MKPRAILIAGLLVVAAGTARADRLVAGDATLTGKVQAVTPSGVDFQPDFAKSPMTVPWDNVTGISTDGSFQVLYGDDSEVTGPLRGYRDGRILIGDVEIEPSALVTVAAAAGDDPGFGERMRSLWRYWHGGFDLGFNLQQATTDNLGLLVGFRTLRAKDPTRLILAADYRYVTERNPSNAPPKKKRTKDAASALVRGEYDLTKDVYLFASTDLLYDAVQNLSLRAVPKLGAGYVLWQRKPAEGVRDFLQVEAGGGWVYEKYIDNGAAPVLPDDDYFTVLFGASAAVLLPRGMTFDWRFDYLPSVSDFTGDYVIRTAAGLTVPLVAPISAKLSISDTYDSTPSAGAEENTLQIDTGVSLVW